MAPVADARAELVQTIEDLITLTDEGTVERENAWFKVEKAIDFFENTVDEASFEAGKIAGLEEIGMERR